MNEYAVYFMLHSIEAVRGGMTRAAIQRANILTQLYSEIGLITFDFNPDYDQVIKQYRENGLWNDKIKHYNVYEFFMNQPELKNPDEMAKTLFHNPSLKNDEESIDQYMLFDKQGRPRKITLHDKKSGKEMKELLLTKEGWCFLERNFLNGNYILFGSDGNTINSFKKVKEYRHHFIQSLLERKEAVLLSDSRFTDKILMGVNGEKAAKVAVLHSNHLQSPYQYGSTLVKRNGLLFNQMNHLDAIITLTESQAEDISNRFGRRSTIHTVGHPAFTPAEISKEHDPFTAVMLVRYEGVKQIPHAIKAFKRVVKKVPESKLEIWGFGREEARYRSLIKRLRMENHVFIRGFTYDVEKTFRRAAFSLITSKSEAFGMSIIESMSVGTPVICYACKYGPTDIIRHEKNGLLVAPGDIKGLADAMISLFLDKKKRSDLSKGAIKVAQMFGEEKLAQKWKDIFNEAKKQKEQRVHIKEIGAEWMNVTVNEEIGIKVEGKVYFKGLLPKFRHKVILFLQMRKRKDMEDLYIPLSVRWDKSGILTFNGEFTDLSKLHKGCWDVNLSVTCLNFHQFVRPTFITPWFGSRNANLKLCKKGQHFFVKVYRPKKKQRINTYLFKETYKAKIRDMIRRSGS